MPATGQCCLPFSAACHSRPALPQPAPRILTLTLPLTLTLHHQYRNGGSAKDAMTALYEEGGIRRFYRGVSFALLQTPLSRFGDTASNSGVLALLATSEIPLAARTALAAGVAAGWRIGITPLDTLKTTLQVKGEEGYDQVCRLRAACTLHTYTCMHIHTTNNNKQINPMHCQNFHKPIMYNMHMHMRMHMCMCTCIYMWQVMSKVDAEGVGVLWQGALANAGASFAGSYPWFLT